MLPGSQVAWSASRTGVKRAYSLRSSHSLASFSLHFVASRFC